jgi:hypothetical protein
VGVILLWVCVFPRESIIDLSQKLELDAAVVGSWCTRETQ